MSRIVPQKEEKEKPADWQLGIRDSRRTLLCLLVSETLLSPVPDGVRVEEEYRFQENSAYSLPEGWERMRLSEKSDYLSDSTCSIRNSGKKRVMELTKKTY